MFKVRIKIYIFLGALGGLLWNLLLFILSALTQEGTLPDKVVSFLWSYPVGSIAYMLFKSILSMGIISEHNFVIVMTISFFISCICGILVSLLLYCVMKIHCYIKGKKACHEAP